MNDQPVQMIGPYRFIAHIGQGKVGHVSRAKDTRNAQPVAIKFLHQHLTENAEAKQRFQRSTELAQSVRHPNIVPITDTDTFEGLPYAVMPYLGGQVTGKVPPGQVATWLQAVEGSLKAIYEHNITHGNLKPENVLLDADGTPYLTDMTGPAANREMLSADASALAAVVCGWLTGQPYRQGTSLDELPASVMPVMKRALDAAPNARFPDAMSFIQDFALAVGKNAVPAPGNAAGPRLLAFGIILLSIVALAGGGYYLWEQDMVPMAAVIEPTEVAAENDEGTPVDNAVVSDDDVITETLQVTSTLVTTATIEAVAQEEAQTEVTTTPTLVDMPAIADGDAVQQTQAAHRSATRTAIAMSLSVATTEVPGETVEPSSTPTTTEADATVTPVATATDTPPPTPTQQPVIVTTRFDGNNVRSADSESAPIIGSLEGSVSREATAISDAGWFQIELEEGQLGWISPDVVDVENDPTQLTVINP